jgi:hypothetical protein
MDTREIYAQNAVEMLERIAAHTPLRQVLNPTRVPAGALCMQTYRAPRSAEERNAYVAEAAYFTAMRRGFSSGHELDDWLTAENEVDARLIGAPRDY